MSDWGISENASPKEKIKSEYAEFLAGFNSVGDIPYNVYSTIFDVGMNLLETMYELGKSVGIRQGRI